MESIEKKTFKLGRPPREEGVIPMPEDATLRRELVRGARALGVPLNEFLEGVLSVLAGRMKTAYLRSQRNNSRGLNAN